MKKPVAFVFCIVIVCVVSMVVKSKNDETTEDIGYPLPCHGFTTIYKILIDPEQSETIYVVGEESIYASIDGGKTWRDIDDSTQVESDFEIFVKTYGRSTAPIINPHRSDIRYDLKNARIHKSINGGIDWIINDEIQDCYALVMDPQNPKVLYSYCKTGPHENKTEETPEGIYKSINDGENWELVMPGAATKAATIFLMEHGARIATFVIDPTNSENIYVGLLGQGVYYSTDGGQRWENVFPVGGSIVSLVIDPIHSDTLYVGQWLAGVYKSTDRGLTWSPVFGAQVPVENRLEGNALIWSLAVDPQNSDILYVGTENHGIFKSIDGGKSWMAVSERLPCSNVYTG